MARCFPLAGGQSRGCGFRLGLLVKVFRFRIYAGFDKIGTGWVKGPCTQITDWACFFRFRLLTCQTLRSNTEVEVRD